MSRLTILLIPNAAHQTKQFVLPSWSVKAFVAGSFLVATLCGYFIFDYIELRGIRRSFHTLSQENDGLRGEARALMANLEEVKQSLRRVQDYTSKLTEITSLKVKKVHKKTGIGPSVPDEYEAVEEEGVAVQQPQPSDYIPIGINMDKLIFKPVFDRLNGVGQLSNQQAHQLQHVLSNLSKQTSLLSSIPSIRPVNGWITSGFGTRVSPFTGKRTSHQGIDIASPVGTPVFVPADGVVIFTGAKAGFGNFIMIAHGYGIVTRYGHNNQNLVQPGQRVERGEQIATVGSSGRSTGPHLHYEVLVDSRYSDPKKFILDTGDDLLTN